MKAVRLKTEYLQDPLGIDIPHPRLFWTCEDGITQSAFQILAATDGRTVWDSGKVPSGSMHADYPNALASRQRVSWRVLSAEFFYCSTKCYRFRRLFYIFLVCQVYI